VAKAIVPSSLRGVAAELFEQAILDRNAAVGMSRDVDIDDTRICFFVQQAVEKTMKAITAHRGGKVITSGHPTPKLMRNLINTGITVPTNLMDVIDLEPCAVELRYHPEIPGQVEVPFDRVGLIGLMDEFMDWALTIF